MIVRLGISLTVGAFITTYIIRSLTIKEYGIYAVLYSLIGYVSVIGSLGIPAVFQRFVPEALQRKEYSLLKQLVFRGLLLRILLSAITVSVILLFHGPIGRLLKIEGFLQYFSIFAWGIVLSLEAGLLTSVLHSLFLHKYSVIASTLYTLFRGGCVFALLTMGLGIRGVLWAEVAAWGLWALLQYLAYYFQFARLHTGSEKIGFPLYRYIRYGGLSSLNDLGGSILGVSTDFFIITAFLGPGAVALYAFADRVIKLFTHCLPHVVLIDVIRPTFFTKYAESGDKQQLADMFNLLVKIGAFCVFPLTAGMLVLGDKMITIVFKSEYLPAKWILWVLMVSNMINIFAYPTGLALQAVEQVQITLYSKIFAVYNLIAELLVIQWGGVMGVVLVTCSAVLFKNLFCYYYAKKYTGVCIDWRSLWTITANAVGMLLILWPLRPFVDSFASLGAATATGVFVYLLASWCNKAFSHQERCWINGILNRRVFAF
jgi:O-antigen/teichoic acid export membrane protein